MLLSLNSIEQKRERKKKKEKRKKRKKTKKQEAQAYSDDLEREICGQTVSEHGLDEDPERLDVQPRAERLAEVGLAPALQLSLKNGRKRN